MPKTAHIKHVESMNINWHYNIVNQIGSCTTIVSWWVPTNLPLKRSTKCTRSILLYLALLLITNAQDTETNPGPNTLETSTKYMCGNCENTCGWEQKAVMCDSCETWFHTNCQGLGDATYDWLQHPNFSWHCLNCGLPNFSTSLFDLTNLYTTNTYHTLSETGSSQLDISGIDQELGPPSSRDSLCRRPSDIVRSLSKMS